MAESDAKFREIDMGAEARRIWGKNWNAPEDSYVFSNKRTFKLRTEDSGVYSSAQSSGGYFLQDTTSADIAAAGPTENFRFLLDEGGGFLLQD